MKQRTIFGRHYALAVVAVIFVALLAAAGLRSTPGVLMVPWEEAFGWSRGTISFAAACGIFLFGLTGPFAAAAMQRFGIRTTVIAALGMMSLSSFASLFMTQPWQLVVTWGLVSGIGSGCITNVLSATIVNRWFVTNRGLVMGLFAASTSTGTLVFIPALSAIAQAGGWQPVVMSVAAAMLLLIPLVFFLLPEWPADVGQVPFGADPDHPPEIRQTGNPLKTAFTALGEGARSRDFWLLAATFFVCGFTTNGLVGTHMIALCHDYGMAAVGDSGKLQICVDHRLVSLFQRSFPKAEVGTYDDKTLIDMDGNKALRLVPFASKENKPDLWSPMGSALQVYRNNLADFPHKPFLMADPTRVADFKRQLDAMGPEKKIGLCWRSMMLGAKRAKYFSPIDHWGPVLQTPGVTFINLQYGDCAAEIARAEKKFGIKIHQMEGLDLKDDIDGAAALCAALDLVLSAPTAAAATAASVGTKVWFLTAGRTWPQLGTPEYPWYADTRVLSPEKFGDWNTLMPDVADELEVFASNAVRRELA